MIESVLTSSNTPEIKSIVKQKIPESAQQMIESVLN
jgi:hypothetical protein